MTEASAHTPATTRSRRASAPFRKSPQPGPMRAPIGTSGRAAEISTAMNAMSSGAKGGGDLGGMHEASTAGGRRPPETRCRAATAGKPGAPDRLDSEYPSAP